MTTAVAVVWAAVVLVGFARHRPAPARLLVSVDGPTGSPPHVFADERLRRWAPALGAAAGTVLLMPLAAPIVLVGTWSVPVLRARRRRARAQNESRRALPEVVDLLGLAIGAGMTVPEAIFAVARRHDGSLAGELRRVIDEMQRGRRCADALDDAGQRLGPEVQPLLAALASSERYGAPLGDTLSRIAADVRADRRRRTEEAARRVPVRLLFPLVLCVLPAFALLTVAPLLASAFASLRH
jgi:tight adherence protein C